MIRRSEVVCSIVTDRERDGRWIAEVHELPGVLVYGASQHDATSRCMALALHVIAEKIEFDNLKIASLTVTSVSN